MKNYLLSIFGSSVDQFYEADTYPEEGDFSHAREIGRYAGGCSLNVAAIAAAKGEEVYALDMLGKKDPSTAFLLEEMKRLHIHTDHVQIKEDVSNGKVIILLTGDKRTMFVIDPIRPPYQVDDNMQELLNNASYIYSLMHMIKRSFKDIGPLLEARKHGTRIFLDGTSKHDDPSRVKMLYDLCDGLFINETDYERLKEHSHSDPKKILFENGGLFICVTNGEKGSTLYLKDRTLHKDSLKIRVSDSTGAGDAFAGCFIACLMRGMDYEQALAYASVNGAYACTRFSALGGVADFESLERFARENHYDL